MHFLAFLLFIGSCLFIATGSLGETVNEPAPTNPENFVNGRFFFGSGDPCANSIYQFLGITDVKCSLQCYIQAGLQNGGYCQDNACICNVEEAGK